MRPRGRLGGRRGNKESVQARLERLEELLESLEQSQNLQQQLPTPESITTDELSDKPRSDPSTDKLHRYVAGPIWAQLSEQVRKTSWTQEYQIVD